MNVKEFRKDESGQAMALMALCTSVIIVGFMAMAIDVGLLYRARQNAQIAADAASVAAAVDYEYNQSIPSAYAAGKAAAANNGYTDGIDGAVVTVETPPSSGAALSTGYFQATVSSPKSTSFMAALGHPSVNVSATSVSGLVVGDVCIWVLASTGTGLNVQGSYNIQSPNCGIYVNSTSSNAILVTGNGGTINAKFLDVVGNAVGHQTSPTKTTTNAAPQNNPWANKYPPCTSAQQSAGACGSSASNVCPGSNVYTSTTFNGSSTLPAAYYPSGLTTGYVCFNASGNKAVTISGGSVASPLLFPGSSPSSLTTSPGIVYVFENGVTFATGSVVSFGQGTYSPSPSPGSFTYTSNAMIDIDGGTLTQQSSSILDIYAPISGPYGGIAVYQPLSNTTQLQVQFGSNNEVLDGYIFAPGAQVFMQDSGGGVTATGIVADTIYEKTSQLYIPLNYEQVNPLTTLNKAVVMVE